MILRLQLQTNARRRQTPHSLDEDYATNHRLQPDGFDSLRGKIVGGAVHLCGALRRRPFIPLPETFMQPACILELTPDENPGRGIGGVARQCIRLLPNVLF